MNAHRRFNFQVCVVVPLSEVLDRFLESALPAGNRFVDASAKGLLRRDYSEPKSPWSRLHPNNWRACEIMDSKNLNAGRNGA